MQELVSFVAIMVGVILLTAWVMWLLLRSSGDSKALQFARESAREGLTAAVMENNHLKNRIKKLERQLKVCLDAGYGKMPTRENSPGAGLSEEDWQDLEAMIASRKKVSAEVSEVAHEVTNEITPEVSTDEPKKKAPEPPALEDKPAPAQTAPPLNIEEPAAPVAAEPEAVATELDEKSDAVDQHDQEPELVAEPESSEPEQAVREAGDEPEIARTQEIDYPEKNVVKPWEDSEDEPEIARTRVIEYPEEKPDDEDTETKPPETGRVVDEAEKKKIDDFLARIAQQSESQKREIEALKSGKKQEAKPEVKHDYPNDSLRKIKGIGPHLEHQLKKIGITSYQQIADFDEDDIRRISEQIGSFPRRIKREGWVEQARKLLARG